MEGKRIVISTHRSGKSQMVVYITPIGKRNGKMKYSSRTVHEPVKKS